MSTTLQYTALSNSGGHTGDGARAEEMKSTGEESNGRRERQTGPFIGPSGPVPERRKSWRAMVNGGPPVPRPSGKSKIPRPSSKCPALLALHSQVASPRPSPPTSNQRFSARPFCSLAVWARITTSLMYRPRRH